MKKTTLLIIACLALFMTGTGCSERLHEAGSDVEIIEDNEGEVLFTFKAVTDSPVKSYAVSGGPKIYWSKGDKLSVFDDASQTSHEFKMVEEAAAQTVEFSGKLTADSDPVYAIFPANASASIDEKGIITTEMNPQMGAISNTKSFSQKSNLSVGRFVKEDDEWKVEMKNVLGYLKFTLPQTGDKTFVNSGTTYKRTYVDKVTVRVTTGYLGGTVKINYNDGEPLFEIVEGTGFQEVSVSPKNYDVDGKKYIADYYYIPVLPGEYGGLSYTLHYTDGHEEYTRSASSQVLTVTRAQYTDVGIFADRVISLAFFENPGDLFYRKDAEGNKLTEKKVTNMSDVSTDVGVEGLWYLEQDGYEYEFGLYGPNSVNEPKVDGSAGTKACLYFYQVNSDPDQWALHIGSTRAYVRTPAIKGMRLGAINACHANTVTGYKRMLVYSDNGNFERAASTSDALVTLAAKPGEYVHADIPESTPNTSYYLYQSNVGSNARFRAYLYYYYCPEE